MQPQILDSIEVLPGPPVSPLVSAPIATVSTSMSMLTPPATLHSPTPSPSRTPPSPCLSPTRTPSVAGSDNEEEEDISTIKPPPPAPRYFLRNYGVAKIARVINPNDEEEPATYHQAVNHPYHGKEWEIATQEEYDLLMKNETWEVVPRPANRNIITSRWVFKHKRDEMGKIVRFKARIVARGFSQIYRVDYLETYSLSQS